MPFTLTFTDEAKEQLANLKATDKKKHKKVLKTLAYLEVNPKHQGLNVHRYDSVKGPNGEDAWEAYVENKTPAAYRVLFSYGPGRAEITVISISPHP